MSSTGQREFVINDITSSAYADKILGCWMGKNCGGTLGGPLEIAWGLPEPFDISWYPRVEPGGIPNDDLELQLVWLKALEEVGPGIRAVDFARYWLNHIGYNPDEYGLSKTNLRLGLLPPVSGFHNNAFRDCMGSPIRSELWACIAPGHPRLAVRYAFEDAICDHAGGEGIYGSLFNTAVESAAFLISDPSELIDIGLSYIPENCMTERAIHAARDSHAEGLDWKEARKRVLAAAPSPNAQYTPPNIGFQIIGWLYGTDFGDSLCKAVNCGYDTDCTGATLGSYLGILSGAAGLPGKWTSPLGTAIALSPSPLIRHVEGLPTTLQELTRRVQVQSARVLAWHGMALVSDIPKKDLYADESVRLLWARDPLRMDWPLAELEVGLGYVGSPVIHPGGRAEIKVSLRNRNPGAVKAIRSWALPSGWSVERTEETCSLEIPAHHTHEEMWSILAPTSPTGMQESNRLDFRIHCEGRPAMPALPVVLLAPVRARYCVYPGEAATSLDEVLPPEIPMLSVLTAKGRPGAWIDFYADGNALGSIVSEAFSGPGILYVQTFVHMPAAARIRLGAAAPCPAKVWVNGSIIAESRHRLPIRPSYAGLTHPHLGGHAYGDTDFAEGWNEVLLKFARSTEDGSAFDAHLTLCFADRLQDGLTGSMRHRFPWER